MDDQSIYNYASVPSDGSQYQHGQDQQQHPASPSFSAQNFITPRTTTSYPTTKDPNVASEASLDSMTDNIQLHPSDEQLFRRTMAAEAEVSRLMQIVHNDRETIRNLFCQIQQHRWALAAAYKQRDFAQARLQILIPEYKKVRDRVVHLGAISNNNRQVHLSLQKFAGGQKQYAGKLEVHNAELLAAIKAQDQSRLRQDTRRLVQSVRKLNHDGHLTFWGNEAMEECMKRIEQELIPSKIGPSPLAPEEPILTAQTDVHNAPDVAALSQTPPASQRRRVIDIQLQSPATTKTSSDNDEPRETVEGQNDDDGISERLAARLESFFDNGIVAEKEDENVSDSGDVTGNGSQIDDAVIDSLFTDSFDDI